MCNYLNMPQSHLNHISEKKPQILPLDNQTTANYQKTEIHGSILWWTSQPTFTHNYSSHEHYHASGWPGFMVLTPCSASDVFIQFPYTIVFSNQSVNSSPRGQNGCHLANNIFRCIFVNEFFFWLEFHWSLFFMVQLTITQHWFR